MQWPQRPPPDLADVVMCTWRAEMADAEHLVPDGCVDVLWIESGALWVCGPERRSWRSNVPAGTRAVGVRLRPGAARHLLRSDVHHLADRRVRGDDLLRRAQARELEERLGGSSDPLPVLVDGVRRWSDVARSPSAVEAAIAGAATRPGRPLPVGALADDIGLSPRHLHRHASRLFGYGYTALVRLVRFQRFLQAMRLNPHVEITSAAVSVGYADHPHLGHECRKITGRSPSQLLGETGLTFPSGNLDPYAGHGPPATER